MGLYRLRNLVERLYSRITALISQKTVKGLKVVVAQVSYAILTVLLIAQAVIKIGRLSKAKSVTYFM